MSPWNSTSLGSLTLANGGSADAHQAEVTIADAKQRSDSDVYLMNGSNTVDGFNARVQALTGELLAPLKPRPCALPGTPPGV